MALVEPHQKWPGTKLTRVDVAIPRMCLSLPQKNNAVNGKSFGLTLQGHSSPRHVCPLEVRPDFVFLEVSGGAIMTLESSRGSYGASRPVPSASFLVEPCDPGRAK